MAKYKEAKVAQLRLKEIPKHISIDRFSYVMKAETQEASVKKYDSGKRKFDGNNMTHQIEVAFDTAKVTVELYLDDKLKKPIINLHHYGKSQNVLSVINLKSTLAKASLNANHIQELQVSQNAEVGWFIVKKQQTFDELLKFVYKKVPSRTELDIFRHANAHISNLQDLNLNNRVLPGQVILITNKKSSPELNEHKKQAIEAEKIFQYLIKQKGFDPEFYANNFELLMDYISLAKQVQIARIEYLKTVEGHKAEYCGDVTLNKEAESANAAAIYSAETKSKFDESSTKRLNEKLITQLNSDISALQTSLQKEVKKGSKLGNNKHYSEFRRQNYQLYQKVEQTISNNFVVMKDNKEFANTLKNIVKDTAGVRAPDFMGGLKLNVSMMKTIGHATISLKLGSKLVLYFYIAESATKVYSASQTENTEYTLQVTGVEVAYLIGGYAGGLAGAALGGKLGALAGAEVGLILAPVTGGVSIGIGGVVGAGLGAVVGGVGMGYLGSKAGNAAGRFGTGICD